MWDVGVFQDWYLMYDDVDVEYYCDQGCQVDVNECGIVQCFVQCQFFVCCVCCGWLLSECGVCGLLGIYDEGEYQEEGGGILFCGELEIGIMLVEFFDQEVGEWWCDCLCDCDIVQYECEGEFVVCFECVGDGK